MVDRTRREHELILDPQDVYSSILRWRKLEAQPHLAVKGQGARGGPEQGGFGPQHWCAMLVNALLATVLKDARLNSERNRSS